MGLVLLATVPSGDASFVNLRNSLLQIIPRPNMPSSDHTSLPLVRHVVGDIHCFPSPSIYVGFGYSDIQGRPSQYANPNYFFLLSQKMLLIYTVNIWTAEPTWYNTYPLSGALSWCVIVVVDTSATQLY